MLFIKASVIIIRYNNKEEKSFECEVDFHDMDILLLDIENHEKISELNVNEFYDEIISIIPSFISSEG